MTIYENLKEKAAACRKAAFKTNGTMREIWLNKAAALETRAANLPVVKAMQENYLKEKHLQEGR